MTGKTLTPEVCTLSFYGGREHDRHLKVTESFLPHHMTSNEFVVEKHKDIANIPTNMVVLVHIGYNARNIILENPGKEVGDLKRTTVRAILAMGATVILFYYDDQRPIKRLVDGELYNKALTAIKEHQDLRNLSHEECVVTLSEKLTDFQKRHLVSKIVNVITN